MDKDKFNNFLNCFDSSFQEVIQEMSGFQVSGCDNVILFTENKFSVIIGIVLANKGRILFEAEQCLVDRITEGMNGEPLDNEMDKYSYLAEFANTFCGHAVSQINNSYFNYEIRLTPPALFVGTNMRIVTPNIRTHSIFYTSEFGQAVLNIGFEGA